MSPLIPLVVLTLGTAALAVGFRPRFRYVGLLASGTAAVALLTTLALRLRLPASADLSDWQPESLFPAHLRLQANGITWPFGLALLCATTAILTTGLARPGGRRLAVRAGILLVTMTSFGAALAGNLLTLAVMWAALDVIYFLALFSQSGGVQSSIERAIVSLGVNSAGTLAIIAVVLSLLASGRPASFEAPLSTRAALLISLAALLRLGLFPPRLALPEEAMARRGLGTILRLGPAVAALAALCQAVETGLPGSTRPWLTLIGLGAAIFGGLQLWAQPDPKGGLSAYVWSASGLALLAGVWGRQAGALGVLAFGLNYVLAGVLLFLSNGVEEGDRAGLVFPIVASAALAGAPLTVGLLANRVLIDGLLSSGGWWLLALVWLAQAMMVAGSMRMGMARPDTTETMVREPLARVAHLAGLGLPVFMLLLTGLFANGLARLAGSPGSGLSFSSPTYWALVGFLITGGLGFAMWRLELDAVARESQSWQSLLSAFGFDWMYRLVWGTYHWISRSLLNLAGVLEGEGAVLWTLVVSILVWILIRPN